MFQSPLHSIGRRGIRCDKGTGTDKYSLRLSGKAVVMKLAQVALGVQDLERATTFYTELLGYPPAASFDPPGLVFFDLDGVRLLLEVGAPPALLYLQVASVAAAVEDLRSRGTDIAEEPHIIFHHADNVLGPKGMDEWMAFVRDSEGNLLGLVSQEPGE
jgi:methylmalonyl-CoA/ethylmalonyl-CoA epimerase